MLVANVYTGLFMKQPPPRPHLAWSQDITTLVEKAGELLERQPVATHRILRWKRKNSSTYQLNVSGIVQIVLIEFARIAPTFSEEQWTAYVRRYHCLNMTGQAGLSLDDESLDALDAIGAHIEHWNWKPEKFVIVARRTKRKSYRKLPIICFALFWFLDSHS